MTDSITPPPELVRRWILESDILGEDMYEGIATSAAQWGADQELEACCEWLENQPQWMEDLRAARRPKPPSLKEQALDSLRKIEDNNATYLDADIIRRALEALPE